MHLKYTLLVLFTSYTKRCACQSAHVSLRTIVYNNGFCVFQYYEMSYGLNIEMHKQVSEIRVSLSLSSFLLSHPFILMLLQLCIILWDCYSLSSSCCLLNVTVFLFFLWLPIIPNRTSPEKVHLVFPCV